MSPRKTWMVETIKSDETHDLLAEGADALLDALSDSDVVESLPVAGSLFKTYKASQKIRERMRVKKLAMFLESPSRMTADEKSKFSARFNDPAEEEEFGEQMLVLIEQAEDIQKPGIIGRLLVAHVKGHFDYSTFKRLCKMVDRAFAEDFPYLLTMHAGTHGGDADVEHSLYMAGFLREKFASSNVFIGNREQNTASGYEPTEHARHIINFGLSTGPVPSP